MKISIVTATRDSALTIRDTVESVLRQTHQDWEHVVVDGLSSDATIEVIREYEPLYNGRLRVFIGKDSGIYDAMNKGVDAATGDVIGILNSDDFYADCEVLAKIAEAIEDVDAVYGNLVFVDADDTGRVVRRWKGSQHLPGAFLKGWHPAHPTFYARRELFERYGNFDTSFAVSADFELMLRMLERAEVTSKYIDYVMVKMRMGGESTGSIKKIIAGNRNILRAFEKNGFETPRFYTLRRLFPKAVDMLKHKLLKTEL